MPWESLPQYQLKRIENIAEWHRRVAAPEATHGQDSSVRYLLLWTEFNALYNVLDMPQRRLRAPDENTRRPRLDNRSENTKLKAVAKLLAKREALIVSLLVQHREFLRGVSRRSPAVTQPDDAEEIHYKVAGRAFVFLPKKARGIASLERRVILEDGHKVFEYSTLTGPVTKDALLTDLERFMQELVLLLYQIRNNVAHGGAGAFFKRGNKVAEGGIAILNSLVEYLLEHREFLVGGVAPAGGLAE